MTFLATKYFTQSTNTTPRLVYNSKVDDDEYDDDYMEDHQHKQIKIKSITSKKALICSTKKILPIKNEVSQVASCASKLFFDCMLKFEDLQHASVAIRKALNDLKLKNCQKSCATHEHELTMAFENLTYLSSNDESSCKKKTIKSIKRKEKLKKNSNTYTHSRVEITKRDETKVTSREFEKRIRKKYRSKSLARSLRRAKTVFYRNQRSKSLEDLSCSFDELKNKCSSELDLTLQHEPTRSESVLSLASSCSSFTSGGIPSDISSSYFHELSDCDLKLSDSDSILSDSPSLDDVNWDENLPDLPMSEYCTSSSDNDDEDTNENDLLNCDCESCVRKKDTNMSSADSLTHDLLENMLSMVMTRMINLNPNTNKIDSQVPLPKDVLNKLKQSMVTQKFQQENQTCTICLTSFELNEEITSLPVCNHSFHFICAKIWLNRSNTCPICRHIYSPNNTNNKNSIENSNNRETLL